MGKEQRRASEKIDVLLEVRPDAKAMKQHSVLLTASPYVAPTSWRTASRTARTCRSCAISPSCTTPTACRPVCRPRRRSCSATSTRTRCTSS
ncbi:hypothetical protein PF003_g11399 [Phytophthora fragariae]|nr:hypothetical protein PF003_g11399 [Phytophthora fragariae]